MEDRKFKVIIVEDVKLELKGTDIEREILYAHFQKRRIKIEKNLNYDRFYFVAPNRVTSEAGQVKPHLVAEHMFEIKRLSNRLHNRLRKQTGCQTP